MRILLLSVPLILAGCASATAPDAPSLLPRAIESRSDAEPVAAPEVTAPDPALDARIAEHLATFDAAAKAFAAGRPSIAAKVERAKGAAEGSDRWLEGQSAIGDLQQLRTAADGAMADLEGLAIERAGAGRPPYPALDAAIATAQVELTRQLETETRLKAVLGA